MQELPVKLNGAILAMEFLYPAQNDDNHVILLVVWAKDRKLRLTCWDWDHSKGLRSVKMQVDGYPISSPRLQEVFPVLLIPLQQSSDFILVGEQDIYLYQGVLTGAPRCSRLFVPEIAPRYPGLSRKKPRWACWARMVRNWRLISRTDENFYLAREDGAVYYARITENDLEKTAQLSKAGLLSCTVNTAFASLDVGSSLNTPDVLCAAGDMSQGELVRIGSWQNEASHAGLSREEVLAFVGMELLPNWAPSIDFLTTGGPPSSTTAGQRESIYTTAGRAPHGAVCELRSGFEARLELTFDHDELTTVTSIWAFANAAEPGISFIMASPMQSLLIRISDDAAGKTVVETEFDGTNCGIDFAHTTLTAALISNQYVIQATPHAVRVLDLSRAGLPQVAVQELSAEETLVAASICRGLSVVIVAIRRRNEVYLHASRIMDGENGVELYGFGDTHRLSAEVTCLTVFRIHAAFYVLAGLANGFLRLLRIDVDGGLISEGEHEIGAGASENSPCVCEGAVVLQSTPDFGTPTEFLVVCSLRNGTLFTVEIDLIKKEGASDHGT